MMLLTKENRAIEYLRKSEDHKGHHRWAEAIGCTDLARMSCVSLCDEYLAKAREARGADSAEQRMNDDR
jgi:hypothetical protein